MGSPLEVEHAAERKVNPVPRRLAETRKAGELLGFRTEVTLKDGLKSLVEWWQREFAGTQTTTSL
jgi:UDP-glucose 4-epimerase